jgi:hypothetical protein
MSLPADYRCRTCGKTHAGVPFSFAADFPDMYANLAKEARDARVVIGSDQCIVDSQWFFVRGTLEIPIIGNDEPFVWGVWASVLEETYEEISECWELKDREKCRGPFKGRLANSLSIYSETLNLKIRIVLQPVGIRPVFILEDTDHPLAVEQHTGITEQAAVKIVSLLLHLEGRECGHS